MDTRALTYIMRKDGLEIGNSGLDRSHIRIALFLFLALNFLFLATSSGRVRTMDEVTLAFEVESMAAHGTTAIPEAVAQRLFYGKYDRFGRPQGPYGPGNAALVVPWFWLGRLATAVTPGIPSNAKILFRDAFMTASSAAFSALAAAFAFLIFVQMGIGTKTAVASALTLGLGTPLFSYSSWFYSEPLASALLLGVTFFLFGREPVSCKIAVLAGILAGLLLWVRATHIIAAPIFMLGMCLRGRGRNWRNLLAFSAVIVIFGGAYLARNQHLFGSPLDFGYPELGEGGKKMLGFDTPVATGLSIFLFSPGKSMLLFAPPLILAIPGIVRLAKQDPGLSVVVAGVPLAFLLFFSRYSHVEGGYSFGPRYLVPAIAMASLGLGPMLADAGPWIRRLAGALLVAGFLIQGIGMATSFLEDMATGAYYDANWAYRADYSPVPRMSRQLYNYVKSPTPAPLGRGFDRWFVFLTKAGVARRTIAAGLLLELSGLLFFCWRLRKAVLEMPHHSAGG